MLPHARRDVAVQTMGPKPANTLGPPQSAADLRTSVAPLARDECWPASARDRVKRGGERMGGAANDREGDAIAATFSYELSTSWLPEQAKAPAGAGAQRAAAAPDRGSACQRPRVRGAAVRADRDLARLQAQAARVAADLDHGPAQPHARRRAGRRRLHGRCRRSRHAWRSLARSDTAPSRWAARECRDGVLSAGS